jgi:hypothetical protein
VVLVSFVLGAFILAAAWIEASASCQQLMQLQALAVAQVSVKTPFLGLLIWKYKKSLIVQQKITRPLQP